MTDDDRAVVIGRLLAESDDPEKCFRRAAMEAKIACCWRHDQARRTLAGQVVAEFGPGWWEIPAVVGRATGGEGGNAQKDADAHLRGVGWRLL
jgi:hypothetical protein